MVISGPRLRCDTIPSTIFIRSSFESASPQASTFFQLLWRLSLPFFSALPHILFLQCCCSTFPLLASSCLQRGNCISSWSLIHLSRLSLIFMWLGQSISWLSPLPPNIADCTYIVTTLRQLAILSPLAHTICKSNRARALKIHSVHVQNVAKLILVTYTLVSIWICGCKTN